MVLSFTQRKRIRKNFGRIEAIAPMPNLVEVQQASYDGFFQINSTARELTDPGLQAGFGTDYRRTACADPGPPHIDPSSPPHSGPPYAPSSTRPGTPLSRPRPGGRVTPPSTASG